MVAWGKTTQGRGVRKHVGMGVPIPLIMVMVSQVLPDIRMEQILYFKYVHFTVCQLHSIKLSDKNQQLTTDVKGRVETTAIKGT